MPHPPSILGSGFTCDVNMVVDMLGTVAVISIAFGAVAEFQIGIIRIGFTAYGAFVVIPFVLHLFLDRFFVMDGFG